MKIGLFFGSFNPIHIGHLALANYIAEYANIDELWFVISPQNPWKQQSSLLDDYHRLELVHRAIEDYPKFRASDVEFALPKPSFTATTLAYLQEKFPMHTFSLIMGGDNLETFHKWKNHEAILEHYTIIVYPRPGCSDGQFTNHPKIQKVNAPNIEISSSFIRSALKEGKNVFAFMPCKVWKYVDEMNFYRT